MKDVHPESKQDELCGLFGITRQGHFQYVQYESKQALEEEIILKHVLEIRGKQPKVGSRKLFLHLMEPLQLHGIKIGRDALFDLLRANNMLVRRRKRRHITTDSNHNFRKYPNLVKTFIPLKRNELWVSDITYLDTKSGFVYLFLITDAYSHEIVGYHVSNSLDKRGALSALRMAMEQRDTAYPLIHHSDRGVQYCCNEYINLLKTAEIQISMTENGDPYENALAERVNGILKLELLPEVFETKKEVSDYVAEKVKIYNEVRLHCSINMLTPAEARHLQGSIPKAWKKRPRKVYQPEDAKVQARAD